MKLLELLKQWDESKAEALGYFFGTYITGEFVIGLNKSWYLKDEKLFLINGNEEIDFRNANVESEVDDVSVISTYYSDPYNRTYHILLDKNYHHEA